MNMEKQTRGGAADPSSKSCIETDRRGFMAGELAP
jgi:hypothetical protein